MSNIKIGHEFNCSHVNAACRLFLRNRTGESANTLFFLCQLHYQLPIHIAVLQRRGLLDQMRAIKIDLPTKENRRGAHQFCMAAFQEMHHLLTYSCGSLPLSVLSSFARDNPLLMGAVIHDNDILHVSTRLSTSRASKLVRVPHNHEHVASDAHNSRWQCSRGGQGLSR